MYDSVKMPSVMTLVVHESLQSHYTLSPFVHLESKVEMKRMNTLSKALNELYDAQLALFAAFGEFRYCYTFGSGCTTKHYLAGLYGSLNNRAKDFKALLNKHGKQPEIAEYYHLMSAFLKTDFYTLMKDDFTAAEPAFADRRKLDEAKYPEWTHWEPLEVDWEVANNQYKKAK